MHTPCCSAPRSPRVDKVDWKAAIVGWLLRNIRVDIDTLCRAIEAMDVNHDGSLDLGELIKGILRIVRG